MTERLQVRVLAGVAGELSFPELTFCVDSHLMSIPPYITAVAHKTPQPFCQKCRWQVTPKCIFTFDPTKSEWADCAVWA